ncbi:MAG: hypothetical protein IPN01_05230 [Deltaproteobacteria bacterium]|nr:hypothetical protein [Deltaproteobacteria bacterium]
MNALFDELKEGLEEAIQHARGEPTQVRVFTVTLPDAAAQSTRPKTHTNTQASDVSQVATKAV